MRFRLAILIFIALLAAVATDWIVSFLSYRPQVSALQNEPDKISPAHSTTTEERDSVRTTTSAKLAPDEAAALRNLRQRYPRNLDLITEDFRLNPSALEVAHIPAEKIPELQEAVNAMQQQVLACMKARLEIDKTQSAPAEGYLAYHIPVDREQDRKTIQDFSDRVIAAIGPESATTLLAFLPEGRDPVPLSGAEIDAYISFTPGSSQPMADGKFEISYIMRGQSGPNALVQSGTLRAKDIRAMFGGIFDDIFPKP